MATLTNNSSGNFTTAATWSLIDPTSFLNSTTGTTATTTSFVSSSAFTPGAITIDGVGLLISLRSSSPTGTFSVRLAIAGVAVTGTTVTVNVTDLDVASTGWVFFKFSAPVTLLSATAYTVQIQSSSAGQVSVNRDATAANWSRYLRTTTTQAPAAGDGLLVCGEYTGAGTSNAFTVTMNNTAATVFGQLYVNSKATFAAATAASQAYKFITNASILTSSSSTIQLGTLATLDREGTYRGNVIL